MIFWKKISEFLDTGFGVIVLTILGLFLLSTIIININRYSENHTEASEWCFENYKALRSWKEINKEAVEATKDGFFSQTECDSLKNQYDQIHIQRRHKQLIS